MKVVALFLFSALLSFQSNTSYAQDTLSFEMNEHSNLLFPGVVNGEDTLLFMLHTAINDFSLISESSQSVSWKDADSIESWGGSGAARYSDSNQLEIGPCLMKNEVFWECQHSGPGSEGKFGLNTFDGMYVEIKFETGELITHTKEPNNLSDFQKCPMIEENGVFFVMLQFEVDGEVLENAFLIHSGYGGTLLLDDAFVNEHQLAEKLEITNQKFLKDSFGNEIAVNKAKLPKVAWLNQELINVPVGFFEGTIARQHMSVLGADFLKRFDVIFDADRAFVYLKTNDNYDLAFSTI